MEDYKFLFKEIKMIIHSVDPLGYVDMGAPDDEYDDYVFAIMSQKDKPLKEKLLKIFPDTDIKEIENLYLKLKELEYFKTT